MKKALLEGYENYEIFEDGSVFNTLRQDYLKGTTNKAGYFYYRLTDGTGVSKTFGRHQLLALCFIPKPDTDKELIVNHKNGVKGDDRINNLEWCTHKENAEHAGAMGLSPKCVPILARNSTTGEVLEFPSMIEAARFFDINKDSMQYRLKNGPEVVYPEGYQYQRKLLSEDWPEGIDRRVVVRDVRSGNERVLKNLAEVCSEFSISPASATKWIKLPNTPILPGYFQMKYLTDRGGWSHHSFPELSLAMFNKTKPVFAHKEGKLVKIYSSARECADAIGLKPSTLSERFKRYPEGFKQDNLWFTQSA